MKKLLSLITIVIMTIHSTDAQSRARINFVVSFPEAKSHYVEVKMSVGDVKDSYIDLKMPNWIPGSYLIREFSKNIERFEAQNNKGGKLSLSKINKNTWRVETDGNKYINVIYRVYAYDLSVRSSAVDAYHAFLSPTDIFLYPDNMLKSASNVQLKLLPEWNKVSTGLSPADKASRSYYAQDFDELYDSPFEIGNHDIINFQASGVDHEIAMYGGGNYNKERLQKDFTKIVDEETAVFGTNPNKKYTFIVHNYNTGGGGLEHSNSTVLGATRTSYANEKSYEDFLGLVAHEYFHLWNVKRLRPVALGPFNYETENYTPNLWIAEGFTSYYDNLILQRTKLISQERYLELLAQEFNNLDNTPGKEIQSAEESSFDTWIKYYRPNENSKNSTISYYNKGAIIAALLDLSIINATKGKKSLDDVMKIAYQEFFEKQQKGYSDDEFKSILEKVSGISLNDFYAKCIRGTEPLKYQDFLSIAGLNIKNENAEKKDASLGIVLSKDGKNKINQVMRNSAAWVGGISANDELIGIDGVRVDANNLEDIIAGKKIGDSVDVLVSRNGLLLNITITLQQTQTVKYKIEIDKTANEEQQKNLKKWLR